METSINLEVRGKGHVPSFKNSKMLTRGRLITKPENQEWMQSAMLDMRSQLRSMLPTTGTETGTEPCPPSLIALLNQCEDFDDSVQWIPEIHVKVLQVPHGMEGFSLTLTPIE